jgi:hypothetical protein
MLPKSVAFCLIGLLSSQGMAEGFDLDFYHARYKLTDPYAKAVDNHGHGFKDLYGVRNFREVLKGVLFRGGANNAYNEHGRRNTKYPLPTNGLDNLCEEGFKTVVYLYPTNYDKAPKDLHCRSIRGSNHMNYPQIRISKVRVLLETIFTAIKDSEMGPVYMHCWNGWHASGYISALSLRQFCGVSGSDAVAYWIRNTDNNDGPEYDDHKRKIASFVPYTDLMIDTTTQRKICPQL